MVNESAKVGEVVFIHAPTTRGKKRGTVRSLDSYSIVCNSASISAISDESNTLSAILAKLPFLGRKSSSRYEIPFGPAGGMGRSGVRCPNSDSDGLESGRGGSGEG